MTLGGLRDRAAKMAFAAEREVRRFFRRPTSGRAIRPAEWQTVDDPIVGDITPARAATFLRHAAHGDISEQASLFDTMLETDGHLRSVLSTRLMAITGPAWELVPANEIGRSGNIDEDLAARTRDYCADVLSRLPGLEAALRHLSVGLAYGASVAEVIWARGEPAGIEPVPHHLLRGDWKDPTRLRVVTGQTPQGVDLEEFPAGKFVVHAPRSIGGLPARGAILRPATLNWLGKRYGKRWWMLALELFGMPITIAKYGQADDDNVRQQLLALIKDVGASRGGVFPGGCEVELLETLKQGGIFPHERLVSYLDADNSKLILGQTLTTQMDEKGGSFAASKTHDEVRQDIRDDDIRAEAETIREQLLLPMVVYRFGDEVRDAVPFWRRVIEEPTDLAAVAQNISTAVNDLGAEVPASVVEDELGIRLVDGADRNAALPGRTSAFSDQLSAFRQGRDAPCPGHASSHSLVAHRHLADTIGRRRGPIARLVPWIVAATLASQAHVTNVVGAMTAWLERKRSSEQALAELPALFDELPIEDLVELEYQLLLAGRLAGIQHARAALGRGKFALETVASSAAGGGRYRAHAEIDFARVPFVRAIESLRDRIGLTPERFLDLDAEARSRAWRVAGVVNMELLAALHTNLVLSIKNGETPRDFRLRLPDMLTTDGWFGENPWHADLVHYQNFVMAHAAGRLGEYQELEVTHWRFANTGDSCPICEPVIGRVFAISDHRFFPPLHFWCDCSDEPVFEDELQSGEATRSVDVPNPALDAEQAKRSAFKWDPASYANLEPLNLARFPQDLRSTFERFARGRGWEVLR